MVVGGEFGAMATVSRLFSPLPAAGRRVTLRPCAPARLGQRVHRKVRGFGSELKLFGIEVELCLHVRARAASTAIPPSSAVIVLCT